MAVQRPKFLTLRVTEQELQAARDNAAAAGLTLSGLLRRLLSRSGEWTAETHLRASEQELAEWRRKARASGVSVPQLVRRSMDRVRTWTVEDAEAGRQRINHLARIGNNLNQIARWANSAPAEEALAVMLALKDIARQAERVAGEG